MSPKPFYITTTLPYVNADPHVGFAVELIRADIIARAKKLAGSEVFFNTGTDEHGQKIEKAAQAEGIEPQRYADKKSTKFRDLLPALGILPEANFIRTTDPHHVKAAQAFWSIVKKNGFIYKKDYSIKYCVGCELEKTDSELVDGKCPLHPLMELEIRHEENYFFKASAFQGDLLDLYAGKGKFEGKPLRIVPETREHEIRSFVSRGLEDFSISRLASKMSWGIPVPDDAEHVMYVWFDALVDYISAIGWPDDAKSFDKWWVATGGVVQYCGKDNLRQQAAMWQAMLMAAGLPPSQTIVVDGFITGDGGLKMSKSLGNTVDPFDIVKEYGTDALRYYALRELHPFEDSPFSMEKFKEAYNAGLANGVGNLTSRVLKLASTYIKESHLMPLEKIWSHPTATVFTKHLEDFNIQTYCNEVWKLVAANDRLIQETEPFKLIKSEKKIEAEKGIDILVRLRGDLWRIAVLLEPIMPQTSLTVQKLVQENKMPEAPLFMRK